MNSKYIIPVATALCVLLLAWFVLPHDTGAPGISVDVEESATDVQARLEALEEELADERDARIDLETRYAQALSAFRQEIPPAEGYSTTPGDEPFVADDNLSLVFRDGGQGDTIVVPAAGEEADVALQETTRLSGRQLARARFEAVMDGREREFLAEQLVANGFSSEEAEHIAKRESELRLEALYDDYETRRQEAENARDAQDSVDRVAPLERLSANEQLRQELGDENYAKFLESSGRATSVEVRSVMESSPAQMSGLLPGDEILSYNGERVFSIQEINEKTVEGIVGESVLLEVERNGEEVQVVLPRGPIGISTGRGR